MVVPKHTAALGAETPLGIAHFRRFVIRIKLDCSNIDLDLVLAANDIESLGIAHHVDTSHVSTYFTTDGTLA